MQERVKCALVPARAGSQRAERQSHAPNLDERLARAPSICVSIPRRWMQVQAYCRACPVCKAGVEVDKVIPIYGRGTEASGKAELMKPVPPRPVGQRPVVVQVCSCSCSSPGGHCMGRPWRLGGGGTCLTRGGGGDGVGATGWFLPAADPPNCCCAHAWTCPLLLAPPAANRAAATTAAAGRPARAVRLQPGAWPGLRARGAHPGAAAPGAPVAVTVHTCIVCALPSPCVPPPAAHRTPYVCVCVASQPPPPHTPHTASTANSLYDR